MEAGKDGELGLGGGMTKRVRIRWFERAEKKQ